MGIVYDGAFRGVHRDALARLGLLAVNKQHGSLTPVFHEKIKTCRSGHELWCNDGRIAESVRLDDGTRVFEPVPVVKLEHRAGSTKSRWYHRLRIPCRHGAHDYRVPVGIATTAEDRTLRCVDSGRPLKSDSERGFHRAEHLQQIPQDTLAHQLVYPYRADSDLRRRESVHSQFDLSLWNRRMIAYGVERQKLFVLGFALSENATSHQLHLSKPHRPRSTDPATTPATVPTQGAAVFRAPGPQPARATSDAKRTSRNASAAPPPPRGRPHTRDITETRSSQGPRWTRPRRTAIEATSASLIR
ncbi:hypothetical protein SIN09_08155 [Streptomyces sp. F8]|uniref:hypothetical protein n=1 Tax=Streptomyces sp. F8 TaxID=1436085 RepID=UPI0029CD88C9|nr:hypothetical protein [Streptomyces sp. F8]MDX6759416.1 hypothetical protein [Streptomyces sp. F8]